MKYFSLLMAALLLIVSSGCEEVPNLRCVQGDGARVVEVREMDAFTRIELDMAADVYLHQDSDHRVEITAQDNLMGDILTLQSNDRLTISNDRCIRQAKTIRIDLYLSELQGLEINGSGDVYSETTFTTDALDLAVQGSGGIELVAQVGQAYLDLGGSSNVVLKITADEIQTELRGSGDLHLHGSTTLHQSEIRGSGNMRAFNLVSATTNLNLQGSGSAEVQVTESLTVKILGSGDVFYKGQPSLSIEVDGSGTILDAN
ncbi:MAG: head GIN domain-containing protein [Bacteroidota bacterium]